MTPSSSTPSTSYKAISLAFYLISGVWYRQLLEDDQCLIRRDAVEDI